MPSKDLVELVRKLCQSMSMPVPQIRLSRHTTEAAGGFMGSQ